MNLQCLCAFFSAGLQDLQLTVHIHGNNLPANALSPLAALTSLQLTGVFDCVVRVPNMLLVTC